MMIVYCDGLHEHEKFDRKGGMVIYCHFPSMVLINKQYKVSPFSLYSIVIEMDILCEQNE